MSAKIDTQTMLDAVVLLLNANTQDNRGLVTTLLEMFDSTIKAVDSDDDITELFARLLRKLIYEKCDRSDPDALRTFVLRMRADQTYQEHKDLLNDVDVLLSQDLPPDLAKAGRCRESICSIIAYDKLNLQYKAMGAHLRRTGDIADPIVRMEELRKVREVSSEMDGVFKSNLYTNGSAAMVSIDMDNPEQIQVAINTHTKRHSNSGTITMGWQGFNRALGDYRGLYGGEFLTVAAATHNYKSSLMLDIATWAIKYNTYEIEEGKKNAVYFASFENDVEENMFLVFRKQYFLENGHYPKDLSDEEVLEWIRGFYARYDVKMIFDRHSGTSFGYEELVDRVEELESMGLKIRLMVLDYPMKMRLPNKNNVDQAIESLFTALFDFTKSRGMTTVVGHQLSRKAEDTAAVHTNAVKKFNYTFLQNSSAPERVSDGLVYLNLEFDTQRRKYLTAFLSKRRHAETTPDAHKYFAMRFPGDGAPIPDDVNGEPLFITDIFAEDAISAASQFGGGYGGELF